MNLYQKCQLYIYVYNLEKDAAKETFLLTCTTFATVDHLIRNGRYSVFSFFFAHFSFLWSAPACGLSTVGQRTRALWVIAFASVLRAACIQMKYQLVARPRKRTADSFGPARTHSVPGEARRGEARGRGRGGATAYFYGISERLPLERDRRWGNWGKNEICLRGLYNNTTFALLFPISVDI